MKKEELQKQLQEIEEKEQKEKEENQKEENYQRWLKRPTDYVVGLAHADLEFLGKRYSSDQYENILPEGISVSGNMGTTYYPKAKMTSSSKTYLHNVWQEQDRRAFQEELNALALKYVKKCSWNLKARLEMMGLQSHHYWVTEKFYPKNKLSTIRKSIEKAQKEILDTYKDKDFRDLVRRRVWCNEDGTSYEETKPKLSHSSGILKRYLEKNRPKLHTELYGLQKKQD